MDENDTAAQPSQQPVANLATPEVTDPTRSDLVPNLAMRVLAAWIAAVMVLTFITVPWLTPSNAGDFSAPMVWFYHAVMIPSVALFLVACTMIFPLHPWPRYIVTRGAPLIAIFESIGLLIRGYGELHQVASVAALGTWIDLPCTLVMFMITAVFLVGVVATTFIPRTRAQLSGQKIEITWALFLSGVSALTWVVFGMVYSASEVGVSWNFWAASQKESLSSFLGNVVTSHSHGMLPSFMAGIVILAAEAFGYSRIRGSRKLFARFGVGVMLAGIALYSGVYTIAGLGTYSIPTWFPSGPGGVNGLAFDDTLTGLVGVGTLIVAGAMIPELRRSIGSLGSRIKAHFDPVRIAVYLTYLMAAIAMYFYGYYIEFNEASFGFGSPPAARYAADQIFTRAHLLFVFGSLPVMTIMLLVIEISGNVSTIESRLRSLISGSMILGMVVTLIGLGMWVFTTPGRSATWATGSAGEVIYVIGQCLMLIGAIIEVFALRSRAGGLLDTGTSEPAELTPTS